MRIICFLFFTIIISLGILHTSGGESEEDRYEAVVDTKVVEYDDNDDDAEEERPSRKDRVRMIKNFVGTNLFGETGCRKKCFSTEDVALLAARRDFESLIPKDLPNCLLDDELARILMQYFYGANQVIEKMAGGHSKIIAQRAFYDTLGGYLKYYMVPISRYSFYAGLVKLRTVHNIMDLFAQCKYSLNTNGNGWRAPLSDFTDLDIQIEPLRIVIRNEEEDPSCTQLDMLDEHAGEDDDMIVALPRLDPEEKGLLGNIWLPFRRKRTFDLQSCMSAFVILRYYELTTRCYKFQGICQDTFNKKLKDWILENLEIHLGDDVLYPGMGAILRIIETIRRNSKGSIIVVSKTNEKRQKVPKLSESKAKVMDAAADAWFQDVFGDTKDKIIVEDMYIAKKAKERRLKYIYVGIGVAVVLLVLVFIGITWALYNRWRNRSPKADNSEPPPPEEKKSGWFGRKSRKDDEEALVKDSKGSSKKSSSKPSKSPKSSKSSVSKKDSKKNVKPSNASPPESKTCFGICSKKDSPAIIETSSMDSDSGKESKKKKKGQSPSPAKSSSPVKSKSSKTVTVDEKKRFSISKKNKPKEKEKEESKRSLIPKDLPNCLLDDELTRILMQYFYGANQVIDKIASGHSKIFAQKAFYDTMGGYLKYYMIPISRYSFYAGLVKLRTFENILSLYNECKKAINTNGNGWRAPLTDFTDLDIQIEPLMILIREEEEDTSCIQLDMLDEHAGESDDMIVALPRLDPEEKGVLGNIWLPFKRKRTFNLRSCMSAFVLLRYFELTTRCYKFQDVCQDTFNKKFKEWILENIEIHLGDDVLYPGLGAVLRITETLRRKNKGKTANAKTDEKRHKTQSYKVLENKAKQMQKPSEDWVGGVFGKGQDVLDDSEGEPAKDEDDEDGEDSRQMLYVYIAIAVAVLLLLFVVGLALIIRQRRKNESSKGGKSSSPPKEKKKSLCQRLTGRSKKDDDEEVLLSADSSSIASSNKTKSTSSVFSCFSKKSPKSKNDSSSKKDAQSKKDSSSKKDKDASSKKGKDTSSKKGKDSQSKKDDPSKKDSSTKRDSLSKKDSSTKKEPSSKKDSKKDSKRASSASSSPPQSPKCFGLCTRKSSPDKSATSMDSDSGKESKKKKQPDSPSKDSKPSATSTPKSKLGTVNEKKRFSISKKNKPKDEKEKSVSLPPETAHIRNEGW